MGNTPKITRITIDNVKYDIDLPSDASPVIDSLEVTRQLIVPVIDDNSNADNLAANKGYVDAKSADLQGQIAIIKAGSDVADVVGTKLTKLDNDNLKSNCSKVSRYCQICGNPRCSAIKTPTFTHTLLV